MVSEIALFTPATGKQDTSGAASMRCRYFPATVAYDRRATVGVLPVVVVAIQVLRELMTRRWDLTDEGPLGCAAVKVPMSAGGAQEGTTQQRADAIG